LLSDERLKGLTGSESHLVASFLEAYTKSDERLDVAAATYGKDRDIHRRLLTLVDGLLKLAKSGSGFSDPETSSGQTPHCKLPPTVGEAFLVHSLPLGLTSAESSVALPV
jgi:hypothetical protein